MNDGPSILHLYTLKFPQGSHEAFLGPELPFLAKRFDEVRIFPWTRTQESFSNLPDNVTVHFTEPTTSSKRSIRSVMHLVFKEINRLSYLKTMRYQMANARQLTARAMAIEEAGWLQGNVLHYSYWMGEWATVLGLLAEQKSIAGYLTRIHGYDLYDERHTLGYQPYRTIQKQGLKKIYAISDLGKRYIASRIEGVPIDTHYLGTEDHGPGPVPPDEKLQVISVARLIPLKRIREMVNILAHCQRPVHWTHIGGGPEEEVLRAEISSLGRHIEVSIRGDMDHDAIMQEYREKPYHLLISLSESEGLPVSMMEAMSFGIPVLSTDVGGVHELVDETTGVLIDSQLDHRKISSMLDDWMLTGWVRTEVREGVREAWKERFSAERNYPRFIDDILSLEWS